MPEHRGAYVPEAAFYGFGAHLLPDSTGTQVAVLLMQAKFVRSVNIGEQVLRRGIENPLEFVELICRLRTDLRERGFFLTTSNDMSALNELKLKLRGINSSPMFNPVYGELESKAFWVGLTNETGEFIGTNAYRIDFVDTNLADWATGWMAGVYMKAGQLMVPVEPSAASGSRAQQLSGWLVYHGELWVAREHRGKGDINEMMTYAGHLLAMLKWNADAMWALTNHRIAVRGTGIQNGYPHAERSFLRWQWHPDDVPNNEWLIYAERRDFEFAVAERLKSGLMAIRD